MAFFSAIGSQLAPMWLDLSSVIFGLLYAAAARKIGKFPRRVLTKEAVFVVGEGTSIVPFILLVPAAFSPTILNALVESSRITLVMSGLLATAIVAGGRFK